MSADNGVFDNQFWSTRSQGYSNLGWVNNGSLLESIVDLAQLEGDETVVDIGTGSQAVLDKVAKRLKRGVAYGFDVSADMLKRREGTSRPDNTHLLVASVYDIPFGNESAHCAIARMVFHHLGDINDALKEVDRILKPGGKLVVSEYIEGDEEILSFEEAVFDIKERGRHLWTGGQLMRKIATGWRSEGYINCIGGILPQYSVRDWMTNSGLTKEAQQEVLGIYLAAPRTIQHKMNFTFTPDGDVLVDRPFLHVTAKK